MSCNSNCDTNSTQDDNKTEHSSCYTSSIDEDRINRTKLIDEILANQGEIVLDFNYDYEEELRRCESPIPAYVVRESRRLYVQQKRAQGHTFLDLDEDDDTPMPPTDRELKMKEQLDSYQECHLSLQGPARIPLLSTPANSIYEPDRNKITVSHQRNKTHVAQRAKISHLRYGDDLNKAPVPNARLSMFNGDIIVDMKGMEEKMEPKGKINSAGAKARKK